MKTHDERHYGVGTAQLLLMRHAQTTANQERCFLGQVNAPLTELGEQQSRAAVDGLCAWQPDRIVTSPLERCRVKIAEPAAQLLGVECRVDERLTEFDFGPLEGVVYQYAHEHGLPLPWGPGSENWPPEEGGETMEAFARRVTAAAEELEALPGKTAVICHGGVIRAFFGAWLGMEVEGWNKLVVDNVQSFVFRVRPGYVALERFGLEPDLLERYR